MANYLPVLESATITIVTHSLWGGWHHVEVHAGHWWRVRFEAAGLLYSDDLTKKLRKIAAHGQTEFSSNGVRYRAQHLWTVRSLGGA